MTLCHLNLARGFRGGERQAQLLLEGLSGQGVNQVLVARAGEPLAECLAGTPGLEISPVRGLLTALWETRRASLMHAHDGRSVHVASARERISGIPYMLTRRLYIPPRNNLRTRWAYRRAVRIVSVSSAVSRVMADYSPNVRIECIHDATADLPVDLQEVQRIRRRYAGKFLVGHVGALRHKDKGQLFIIEAARGLARRFPDMQFLLVGDGEDAELFRREAAGVGNVSLEGFRTNVGDYLSALDLFVFPSLMEGLGSTLLDAMQFGLPIVASRVGGIPDLVIHDETGLLTPPGSATALRDAISSLYEDRDRMRRLGEAGRRRSALFSAKHMVERYLEIYRSLGIPA